MLFEIEMEVKDSAVTLSPALAKYMVRHNQGKEKELRVMPFMTRAGYDSYVYGWDINPKTEDTGLPKDYVESLDVIQWNEEDRCVGFLMNNPNVTGVLVQYKMRDLLSESMDTGRPVKLLVRPRMWHGRMQYMLEPTRETERDLGDWVELWMSRWLVRLGM